MRTLILSLDFMLFVSTLQHKIVWFFVGSIQNITNLLSLSDQVLHARVIQMENKLVFYACFKDFPKTLFAYRRKIFFLCFLKVELRFICCRNFLFPLSLFYFLDSFKFFVFLLFAEAEGVYYGIHCKLIFQVKLHDDFILLLLILASGGQFLAVICIHLSVWFFRLWLEGGCCSITWWICTVCLDTVASGWGACLRVAWRVIPRPVILDLLGLLELNSFLEIMLDICKSLQVWRLHGLWLHVHWAQINLCTISLFI